MNSSPHKTRTSSEESQAPSSWHSHVRWLGPAESFPSIAFLKAEQTQFSALFVNVTFSFPCHHPGGTAEVVMLYPCWSCAGENARIGKVTVIRITIAMRFMIIHAAEVTSVFWVNC